jgi:cytoskeleton protein RodZ
MKRLSRPDPSAGEAARLGEQLRDARIALGLSIEDMAASLRIRRVYLAALEEGRVRELPAPAYVLGFVRTYARALGLDDDDMVRRFREAASSAPQRRTDLIFPEPVPERGIPAGVVVMAGVVLVVGAYMAWFQWSGSGTRTVDTVPPMPARLEQAARGPAQPPLPSNLPPAAGALIAGALQQPGQQRPAGALPPGPPSAIAATAPTMPSMTLANPAAPSLAIPPTPRPDESRISLRAKADTWVSLRDRTTNTSLVNRLLKAGETLQIPPQSGLMLTIGYAAGTEIVVDGLPIPAFPANTSVKRDIPMDPERLKAGNFNPAPVVAGSGEAPSAQVAAAPTTGATAAPATTVATAPRPAAPRPRPVRPEDRAYEPPQ